MKKIIYILILMTFYHLNLFSQSRWTLQCPSPLIDWLYDVEFKDINTGIINCPHGLYMTTNGSISWFTLNVPNNYDGSVSYNNYGKWFLASSLGRYSTNNGATWIPYNGYIFSKVTFLNPNTGTALSSLGEYAKTTDGGQNWIYYNGNFPLYNWPMSQQMINDSTVFIGCDNGLLAYTTNGGLNFTGLFSGSYDNHFIQTKFVNSKTGYVLTEGYQKIYKTTNGGFNWSDWNMILTGDSAGYFDFLDSNTGIISTQAGILLTTTNGGKNWTYKSLDSLTGGKVKMFNKDSLIIAGYSYPDGAYNLIRSTDFGNSFTYLNNDARCFLYGIHFVNKSIGYSVGDGGKILKTTNGGTNWTPVHTWTLTWDPFSHHSVYSTDSNTTYAVGWNGHIIKTTNGGNNWFEQISGTTNVLNKIYFVNHNTGFIVGEYGNILKTTNAGDLWFSVHNYALINFSSVFMLNSRTGFVTSDSGMILKTTNGGRNWVTKNSYPSALMLKSISFSNQNTGFAVGDSGVILRTNDGGENWEKMNLGITTPLYDVSMYDNNLVAACGDKGKILITSDGGDKWVMERVDTSAHLMSIQIADSAIAYICGEENFFVDNKKGIIYKKSLYNLLTNVKIQKNFVDKFELMQNYPNPFNPTTSIRYSVSSIQLVKLIVYDILGREIATLVNEVQKPGVYEIKFPNNSLTNNQIPSGIYFYTLTAGDFKETKKLVLLK